MRPILPLLRALNDADVDYVVVGGVAVVLRGHPRMTVDLDLVVDLDQGNVARALAALSSLGLVPRLPVDPEQFADPETRTAWVEQRNLEVFTLHDPEDPRREVDLFAHEPRPFGELRAAADVREVDGVEIPVASIDHLIEMKRRAGRTQDLADIEALERLRGGGDDA